MKSRISLIAALILTALVALVLLAVATHAQTDGSPPEGDRSQWRVMRQERMAACVNQSVRTLCSFSREGQTVSGTCQTTRQGQLACRNGEGRRGGEMRGPMGGDGMPGGNAPGQ